ncbi:MAG TPA: pyridoxal-dependent decarboxylase [Acidimicrobiales bacterium]|nr:pyridoxal-dependent decarboxylase [Acidimicrobiales bacterium]
MDETASSEPRAGIRAGHRFDWHPEPPTLDLTADGARPALEELGRRAWTLALDYIFDEALARPVGPDSYEELRARFFGPSLAPASAPATPSTSSAVLDEVRRRVSPYAYNAYHPRSFSYFTPPPLPMSVIGELLCQVFHQGIDVFHSGPIGALVEEEVTRWLADLVGAGAGGWGVLTSGGVMANVMAMTVARECHLARLLGPCGPPRGRRLETARVYVSDQAHFSIGRALDMLGFPPEALVVVESDTRFRLQAAPVASRIAEDRSAGLVPFCIAAVCGSTNTGSVDDVPGLANLARREQLWLHVDAAYGGAARLSARDAGRVSGLELADSVTVDPHKWLFQAYDIGGLVVRRREDLHRTFDRSPEYYRAASPETEPLNWLEFSMEGTRRFRALKLWTSWKHLGSEGFARLVEHDNDVAAFLASELARSEDFDIAVEEPDLSIVCFRHLVPGLGEDELDAHQDRLQRALEISGEAWVSTTKLRGRTYLRAGVLNWLSTEGDTLAMLESLRRLASSFPGG